MTAPKLTSLENYELQIKYKLCMRKTNNNYNLNKYFVIYLFIYLFLSVSLESTTRLHSQIQSQAISHKKLLILILTIDNRWQHHIKDMQENNIAVLPPPLFLTRFMKPPQILLISKRF